MMNASVTHSLSVLYVEDCAELQEAIADLLRDGGDDVVCCQTAVQARALMRERAFDVLLSDVKLEGGISGIELARLVLAERASQWVILCSGAQVEPSALAMGRNVRALAKPFDLSALETMLDEARAAIGAAERREAPGESASPHR